MLTVVPGDRGNFELNIAFHTLGPNRHGLEVAKRLLVWAVDLVAGACVHRVAGGVVPGVGKVGKGQNCVAELAYRRRANVGLEAAREEPAAGRVLGAKGNPEAARRIS